MFIGYYNKSIILTFISLFCSVLGIILCFDGEFYYSSILMVFSGICDCFDGYVASFVDRTKEEKLYGVQLDSLVDAVCFGVFPIVLSVSLGYKKFYNIIVYLIYIFCGITRLCYFNVDKDNAKFFKGVPITTVSFLLPFILIFTVNEFVIMLIFLILGFFFLYNIRINKLNLKFKKVIFVVGILLIFLILWRFL